MGAESYFVMAENMNIMLQHSSLERTFVKDICVIDEAVISIALEGISKLISEGRDILGCVCRDLPEDDTTDEPEGKSGKIGEA